MEGEAVKRLVYYKRMSMIFLGDRGMNGRELARLLMVFNVVSRETLDDT